MLSWQVGFSVGAESDDELEVSERMLVFMLAFYERYPSLLKVPLFLSRKVWRKDVVTWLPCQGTSRKDEFRNCPACGNRMLFLALIEAQCRFLAGESYAGRQRDRKSPG